VENILPGKVESNNGSLAVIDIEGIKLEAITVCKPGELVWAIVRPEDITFAKVRGYTSARNVFPGRIQRVASVGALVRIEVDCGFPLLGVLTKRSAEDIGVEQGGEVYVSFKATAVHVIGRQ
jgi:molybdopterin-binding protein